eukprot:2425412-Ditylum_brightwellii.AAC.1
MSFMKRVALASVVYPDCVVASNLGEVHEYQKRQDIDHQDVACKILLIQDHSLEIDDHQQYYHTEIVGMVGDRIG